MPKRSKGTRAPSIPAAGKWWTAGLLIAGAVFGMAALSLRESPGAAGQTDGRPIQVAEDGYASSDSCRACHSAQYDSWHTSFHRTMTQVATPDSVQADFDGAQVAEVLGRPMLLQRRGAEFWAEFDDPDAGRFGPPSRITRQVVMITGSHHQQAYWYRTDRGRLLGQIPATYIIAERRWIPRLAVFLRPANEHPPSGTGNWNAMCINCHVTHGKAKIDLPRSRSAQSSVGEFGIGCEACHGPSGPHARANQNPVRRYSAHLTGGDDTAPIVPATLEPKAASQVCGQCHGVFAYTDRRDELSVNSDGHAYRPGQDLFASRFLVRPSRDLETPRLRKFAAENREFMAGTFWSDGRVRVSGREYNGLIDSPCYLQATDAKHTLTCFSCHSMHQQPTDKRPAAEWADTHQVSSGMDSNRACIQCHERLGTNLTAHTKHREGSSGSSCYNCHMPYTSYGLLKAVRSHQISTPTVTESVKTGRPNACNACHLDKTLAWTAKNLEQWYGTSTAPLTEDERTIAASLLWSIKGDAGQRALMAWAMGWRPAQEASGTAWVPAHLAPMFDDPYDAVRFIAYRSMRSLPGFTEFRGDFLAPSAARRVEISRVVDRWRPTWATGGARSASAELLLNADGSLREAVLRLLRERDNRPVVLAE